MRALAAAALVTLVGCAQPPKQLYLWENFTRQQYQYLSREGTPQQEQIQALEAHIEKARAANAAVPPGLRAHLGMLQLAAGNAGAARDLWMAEKSAFPESAPYIDSLLKRLDAQVAPAPSRNPKENPA